MQVYILPVVKRHLCCTEHSGCSRSTSTMLLHESNDFCTTAHSKADPCHLSQSCPAHTVTDTMTKRDHRPISRCDHCCRSAPHACLLPMPMHHTSPILSEVPLAMSLDDVSFLQLTGLYSVASCCQFRAVLHDLLINNAALVGGRLQGYCKGVTKALRGCHRMMHTCVRALQGCHYNINTDITRV